MVFSINCAKGVGVGLGLGVRVSVSLTFLPLHCPLANDAKVARSNCLRAVPTCLCKNWLNLLHRRRYVSNCCILPELSGWATLTYTVMYVCEGETDRCGHGNGNFHSLSLSQILTSVV